MLSTTVQTDKAMALDGLETAIKALTELMNDPETRSIFKTTFRHRDFYNNDTKGIQCWAQPVMPWVHGPVVRKAVAEVSVWHMISTCVVPTFFNYIFSFYLYHEGVIIL